MRPLCHLAFLAISIVPCALAQNTWYVDDDGTGSGTGTIDDPYTSIQFAIDHSNTQDDDILLVMPGVYAEDVNLAGKRLSILGDAGDRPRIHGVGVAAATLTAPPAHPLGTNVADFVLVAAPDGSQRCLELEAGANLDAVRVLFEGGKDPFLPDSVGGQVRVTAGASLELQDCVLRAVEEIQRGGAIAVDEGALGLVACDLTGATGFIQGRGGIVDVVGGAFVAVGSVFRDGYVADEGDHGGAIALFGSTGSIEGCDFINARASQAEAGAIWSAESVLTITDSAFVYCSAWQGAGGAILASGGVLQVTQTEFSGCFADDGGAVKLDTDVTARFEDCRFFDNTAWSDAQWGLGDGGAVFGNEHAEFFRCLFVGNDAHGVPFLSDLNGVGGAITAAATVECCTFFDNFAGTDEDPGEAGALAWGDVSSSIVWASAPAPFAPGVVATDCDVQGGWPGEGNIDAEPLFLDLEGGDFGLSDGSPCIDAGSSEKPLDEDGTPADQGAFPYTWMSVGESYCFANPNSSGLAAEMTVLGSATLEMDFLRLRATSLPPLQFGYFLAADAPGFVPGVGGGMGNLCLGMPFVRLGTEPWGAVLFSGLEGRFELRARLLDLPKAYRPQSGETWHFQAWFRDVVGSDFTSNTSDAVELFFE